MSRARDNFTSLKFPIFESCHLRPLLKLKLVGFFPFGYRNTFVVIRHPKSSPVMVPLVKKSEIGHVQAEGLPRVLLVWERRVLSKLLCPMQLARFLRCEMKFDLPDFCTAE